MSVQIATVASITGEAFARQLDGTLRQLTEGDALLAGETLVVNNGSQATLNFDGNELVNLTGPQELPISETQITASAPDASDNTVLDPSVAALLAALDGDGDLLDELEAPAAGTDGAPDGGGSSFVQLTRISESVDPLAFQFSQEFVSPFTIPIGESIGVAEAEPEDIIPPTVSPLGGEVNETGSLDSFTQSLGINLGGLSGTVTLSSPGAVWNPETNTLTYGPDSYGGSWQIEVNPDGTYTFTQTGAMEHPDSDDPNDVVPVEVTVTVVSENGLSAESSFIVNIFDDGPSIIELNTDAEGLALNVFDEGTLQQGGSTDKFDLSDLFSVDVDYGTDGPGSVAWTYALGLVQGDLAPIQLPGEGQNDFSQDAGFNPIPIPFPIQLPQNAVLSGLTSSGSAIILELSIDQQTITGSIIGEGTDTVFTLEIVDGELILTQFLPIDHLVNGAPVVNGEPVEQLNLSNLVSITGSVTVTDRDGDTVSQSTEPFNLGELITFNDDEPSFDIDDIELGNILLNTSDADIGAEDGNTDSASFAAAFLEAVNPSYGADGEGSTVISGYALSVTSNGGASGLTSGDEAIVLSMNGVVVEGKANGTLVFTLSVDSDGEVILEQFAAIDHVGELDDEDATNNSANSMSLVSGSVALSATVTVTDSDDDPVTDTLSVDISSAISFDDDLPSINAHTRVELLNESFETFSTTNSWTVVKGQNNTIVGNNGIEWTVNSAGIEIQAGRVGGSAASDGNYHAELDPRSGDGNTTLSTVIDLPTSEVTLSFDYRPRPGHIADSDMKVSLGDIDIIIDAQSDGTILISSHENVSVQQTLNTNGWTTITLTFSGIATGSSQLSFEGLGSDNSFGAYLDNINMFADTFGLVVDESDLLVDAKANVRSFFESSFGADGAGDMSYTLNLNAGASGLVDTATGNEVFLFLESGTVIGREGADATAAQTGEAVFTLGVSSTGEVTLDQIRALAHSDDTTPNDAALLNSGLIDLVATITDGDGDSRSASIDASAAIRFYDDGPTAHDDLDSVDRVETDSDLVRTAGGNVISGADTEGTGVDNSGADAPASVVKVVGFDGSEDSTFDSNGDLEVNGQFGTLAIKANGSYIYTVDPDKLPAPTTLNAGDDGWNVSKTAFQLGQSFFDDEGKYSDADANGNVTGPSGNEPGYGVSGTSGQNSSVAPQINYSGSLSEALAFNFGGPVSSATVTVSNLFQNERGGEAARWHAFDDQGVRVASGVISQNDSGPYDNTTSVSWGNANGNQTNNVGTFTVSGAGAFNTLVFEALPYSRDGHAEPDNSDYFVNVVSYDALPENGSDYQDVFTYTLADGDGDTDTATLTINGYEPNPSGNPFNQAPVAVGNNYRVVSQEVSGNIITDDNDQRGAASGRDWDADTPVLNLSVGSVKVPVDGELQWVDLADGENTFELENGELVISADGKFTYTPNDDYASETDTFEYHLVDAHGKESENPATVTFNLPTPTDLLINVVIGESTEVISSITNENYSNTESGYTVTAYGLNQQEVTVGSKASGSPTGFGVDQSASGAKVEIGENGGNAQRLEVNFDEPVSSVDLWLAWLNKSETAVIELWNEDEMVDRFSIKDGSEYTTTDRVDGPFAVSHNGEVFNKMVFTVPTDNTYNGDDYLVHRIDFVSAHSYPLTVTVTPEPADTGAMIADVTAVNVSVPDNATLSHGTDNGDGSWTLPLSDSGGYTVVEDPNSGEIVISGLSLTMVGEALESTQLSLTATGKLNDDPLEGEVEVFFGTEADDSIIGTAGSDILYGGAGNDALEGVMGADVFRWVEDDQGSIGLPATDEVLDFTLGVYKGYGEADQLDLADLLQGEENEADLSRYIAAEENGSGDTLLYINSKGSLDNSDFASSADQVITLTGVEMDSQTSEQFIESLLSNNQLKVD